MGGEARPAPGAAGGLALTIVEGGAVLAVEGRPLPPLGRADRLEIEVPGLRFPFDVSGGVSRFASRRCRLRELAVSAGAAEVASFLRGERLAEMGIFDPLVAIAGAELTVEGWARLGRHQAGFTVRAAVRSLAPRRARISLYDVRVYGLLPVSAPMLASALFAATGATPGEPRPPHPGAVPAGAPLLWLEGATDLQLELVELALLALLPAQGWRMPERGQAGPLAVETAPGRVVLRYGWQGSAAPASDPLAAYDESRQRHAAAEAALARGEIGEAAGAYRRARPVAAGDPWAAARLLQLLAAGASTLDEAALLAGEALARWPGFAPALLARATAASAAGRPEEAAAVYQELADAPGTPLDRASALVAAARERERAGDGRGASQALVEALAACPAHGGAARAREQRLAAEERWPELLRALLQRAVDEPDATAKAALYAQAGFVYLDRLDDRARARDRFEQAVRLAPGEPAAWEGLGRLARAGVRLGRPDEGEDAAPALDTAGAEAVLERAFALHAAHGDRGGQARVQVELAALASAAGDEAAAQRRLLEAAALDEDAVAPLRQAGELALARGEPAEAARLLERALARSGALLDPRVRLEVVARLAEVRSALGEPLAARMLLEQVLGDHPCEVVLLDALGGLLGRVGAGAEWEPFLRRALEHAARPEQLRAALVRLGNLARERGDDAELADVLIRLVEARGPEAPSAGVELAVLAQGSNDPPLIERAAEALATLLGAGGDLPGPRRAELAWRLAGVVEQRADEEGTLHWLRTCLEGEADGLVAAAAWRRFVEIAARRGDAGAAAQALISWADDPRTGENERERAAHLVAAAEIFRERLNLVDDMAVLLERAASLDPLNDAAFAALDELATQAGDRVRVAEVLERRAAVARPGEQRVLWARLGALLADERPADAAEFHGRLLQLDPDHPLALAQRARHFWSLGRREESAAHDQRLLALARSGVVGAAVAAEAHLRLAFTAPGPELDEHVAQALAAEPAGAPVGLVVEALQALGRDRDLADVLARRDQDGDGDRQLWRLRAEVLERLGAVDEAAALYGDLVAAYPDDVAALKALAGLYRRPGRSGELAGVLERLWALATAPQGARDLDGETRAVGLELAELLAGPLGDAARAEEILRAVLHAFPDDPRALEALSDRLAARGADDEADALLLRLAALAGGIGRVGERVVRLARRPDLPPAKAAALLERALTAVTAPRGDVADALTEVLPRLPDRDERRRALLRLRDRALPLSPQARARLAAALAEVGEVS